MVTRNYIISKENSLTQCGSKNGVIWLGDCEDIEKNENCK